MGQFRNSKPAHKMKAALLFCIFLGLAASALADHEVQDEARFLYFNPYFNSTMASTATTLNIMEGIVIFGAIGYLLYSGDLFGTEDPAGDGYGAPSYGAPSGSYGHPNDSYDQPGHFRSASDGFNIIQWIAMLQDLYEKFDYYDLDCQKRFICEVMKEPEYYGSLAQKFKNGFQYAKYLEVLSLPDDMREILEEYLDATARAEQQKECSEFFQCPYSIKESVKRHFNGNSV